MSCSLFHKGVRSLFFLSQLPRSPSEAHLSDFVLRFSSGTFVIYRLSLFRFPGPGWGMDLHLGGERPQLARLALKDWNINTVDSGEAGKIWKDASDPSKPNPGRHRGYTLQNSANILAVELEIGAHSEIILIYSLLALHSKKTPKKRTSAGWYIQNIYKFFLLLFWR